MSMLGSENNGRRNDDSKLKIAVVIVNFAVAAVRLALAFVPGCDQWPPHL